MLWAGRKPVDRRTTAVVFAAAAVCAILLARFYAAGNGVCLGPHMDFIDERCRSAEMTVGLEILATVLAAFAVGFWTARRKP